MNDMNHRDDTTLAAGEVNPGAMPAPAGEDIFELAGRRYRSRLLLGTSRYPNPQIMIESLQAGGTELVTVSIRRVNLAGSGGPDGSGWRGGQPGRVAASQSALRGMISGKWCERIS